ncbi:MAG: dienelactone hydrolase family protein [Micavibrio sp.]
MTMQTIPTRNGETFQAYIALPDKLPAPCVILIQEIFGVNSEMRAKCDDLAARGYIAVCPDLFWRMEPGVQLTDKTEAEWARAFDFFNRFDIDLGIEDLRATAHFCKGYAHGNGHVGAIGYCLGGKLAYLMAARTNIDCAIGYYGVGLDGLLGESANIKNPLMLHIAEEDKFVSKEAQKLIKDKLATNNSVTIHSYANVDHAFARGQGQHYDEQAATLANQRSYKFLNTNLLNRKAA